MAKLIRRQVTLAPAEDAALTRVARERGLAESEPLRRGAVAVIEDTSQLSDPRAWERELRFIRRRACISSARRRRGWTREELYDERLRRLPR